MTTDLNRNVATHTNGLFYPNAAVYSTAQRFVDVALTAQGSLFTPGRAIWSAVVIDELLERLIPQKEKDSAYFLDIAYDQLNGASPGAVQLAAEVLYVHYLIPRDIVNKTKRKHIYKLLALLSEPLIIPVDMDDGLEWRRDRGTVHGSRTYFLAFLLRFARAWGNLSATEHEEALRDPWSFKRQLLASRTPEDDAEPQFDVLLHLLFPATFEPLLSEGHKVRIVDKFAESEDQSPDGDIDLALQRIRIRLTSLFGTNYDYYSEPVRQVWQP
jgi:5-methylcytosine-specific restriction enzyme B